MRDRPLLSSFGAQPRRCYVLLSCSLLSDPSRMGVDHAASYAEKTPWHSPFLSVRTRVLSPKSHLVQCVLTSSSRTPNNYSTLGGPKIVGVEAVGRVDGHLDRVRVALR